MNIRPFYSGTVSEKIKLKKSLSLLDYGDDTLFDQLFFNDMGNRIAGVFQKHEKKAGRPWEKIGIDATKTWKRKTFSWPVLKIKKWS